MTRITPLVVGLWGSSGGPGSRTREVINRVAFKEMGQYFNILTSATIRVMHTDKNIVWPLNTRRQIRLVNANYIGKGQHFAVSADSCAV